MFKPLFTVSGVFVMALGVLLLAAPQVYLSLYVPRFDPDMVFAAQRLAPAVIGLGALLLVLRDLPKGVLAARVAAVGAAVWLGVAATGVFHFATGVATVGILVAAASELILAVLFLVAARQMKPE